MLKRKPYDHKKFKLALEIRGLTQKQCAQLMDCGITEKIFNGFKQEGGIPIKYIPILQNKVGISYEEYMPEIKNESDTLVYKNIVGQYLKNPFTGERCYTIGFMHDIDYGNWKYTEILNAENKEDAMAKLWDLAKDLRTFCLDLPE